MSDAHVGQDKLTTNVAVSDGSMQSWGWRHSLLVQCSPVKHGPRVWIPSTHGDLVPPVYNPSAGRWTQQIPELTAWPAWPKSTGSWFSEKLSTETR